MLLRGGVFGTVAALIFGACVNSDARDKHDWASLNTLTPGQKVTAVLTSGKSMKGEYRKFSNDAVTVSTANGEISLTRATVSRISVGSGLKRLRNTAIGLGMGGLVGALIATKTDVGGHRASAVSAALFSFGVGGIAGAIMPSQRTVYEAPPPSGTPDLRPQ